MAIAECALEGNQSTLSMH